jgi:hypothetical protein
MTINIRLVHSQTFRNISCQETVAWYSSNKRLNIPCSYRNIAVAIALCYNFSTSLIIYIHTLYISGAYLSNLARTSATTVRPSMCFSTVPHFSKSPNRLSSCVMLRPLHNCRTTYTIHWMLFGYRNKTLFR